MCAWRRCARHFWQISLRWFDISGSPKDHMQIHNNPRWSERFVLCMKNAGDFTFPRWDTPTFARSLAIAILRFQRTVTGRSATVEAVAAEPDLLQPRYTSNQWTGSFATFFVQDLCMSRSFVWMNHVESYIMYRETMGIYQHPLGVSSWQVKIMEQSFARVVATQNKGTNVHTRTFVLVTLNL